MKPKKKIPQIKENLFLIEEKRFDVLTKSNSYLPSVSYLGICLILAFLLMSLTSFYFYFAVYGNVMGDSLNTALFDSGLGVLGLLFGFFVFHVLFCHASARLLGAKKGLQKTFQVQTFAYTPYFFLGWLWTFNLENSPIEQVLFGLGVIFSFLAVVNGIVGLKRIHRISFIGALISGFVVPLAAYMALVILVMKYGLV